MIKDFCDSVLFGIARIITDIVFEVIKDNYNKLSKIQRVEP